VQYAFLLKGEIVKGVNKLHAKFAQSLWDEPKAIQEVPLGIKKSFM
jgi:hypothetical protein